MPRYRKRLPLSVASPFHGCDEGADESINGTIVIVGRGTCQFLDKVRRMQKVQRVVVADNEGDHIFSMDHDEAHSGSGVNIPSVMISQYDGYDVAKAVVRILDHPCASIGLGGRLIFHLAMVQP